MTEDRRPGKEAREIIERALESYAPSRTQLKKMVAAVLEDWRPSLAAITDSDRTALILLRVED